MTGIEPQAPSAAFPPSLADPQQLDRLRRDMLRFARLQLRDAALAEDAVQEAIEAALVGAAQHAGLATFKTWIFTILRNKIVDLLRRGERLVALSAVVRDEAESEDEAIDALFNAHGHWQPQTRPSTWATPDAALTTKEFWAVFEACLEHLPEAVARVFMMREMLGLETPEICAELGITSNNCHVILHRARTGLRGCLEGNWFTDGEKRTC